MIRPTLIDLNSVDLKYYLLMISSDKCNGRFNVSSPKICVAREIKDINVKVFSMITNQNEAKTMTKYISSDYKFKFNGTTSNSNQEWNNKVCQCECKKYCKLEKKRTIVAIIAHVLLRIAST